jgi:hypothetical protein
MGKPSPQSKSKVLLSFSRRLPTLKRWKNWLSTLPWRILMQQRNWKPLLLKKESAMPPKNKDYVCGRRARNFNELTVLSSVPAMAQHCCWWQKQRYLGNKTLHHVTIHGSCGSIAGVINFASSGMHAHQVVGAAKSHELLEFDFGYYDMGKVLTCREQSFESIIDDPSLILDKEFMLEQMFKVISDQVDPFTEYIEHMYEQKVTLSVTGVNNDDLFYDDLRFNLFYPLPADIVQSRHICHALRLSLPWHFLKSSETRRNQPIIILTAQEASTVWEIYRRLNGSLDSALKLVIALPNQFMHRQHSR